MHFPKNGGLVERAAELLNRAPLPTAELARQVLHLNGNAGAAATAVYTLLGSDPRFEVDVTGLWSLALPEPTAPAAVLREEEWVVVDVETTGGASDGSDRVTEVAAVIVSGGQIRDVYSTLVNPQRTIPPQISRLTGISNSMVRDAPLFGDIAGEVVRQLAGRVFVAHNASFDWRFMATELDRCTGHALEGRQLCTVRLARKLLPELQSRSLDGLAVYYGLQIEARHRARDDAIATAEVLLRFIDLLEERGITHWDALQKLLRQRKPRRKPSRMPRSMEQA